MQPCPLYLHAISLGAGDGALLARPCARGSPHKRGGHQRYDASLSSLYPHVISLVAQEAEEATAGGERGGSTLPFVTAFPLPFTVLTTACLSWIIHCLRHDLRHCLFLDLFLDRSLPFPRPFTAFVTVFATSFPRPVTAFVTAFATSFPRPVTAFSLSPPFRWPGSSWTRRRLSPVTKLRR